MNKFLTICASFILSCMLALPVSAQGGYKVKGVVFDQAGPVIGATVLEQGTTNGVSTELDGDFTLSVRNADAVIEISCIGYATQSFKASALPAKIVLVEDAMFLDDVVVIGYGTVKKGDMTGSVATVKADELNKGMVTTPADLLKGKSAGVVITPGSGQPGSGATIRIRGGASLNATNDPLIIIDGLPVSNGGISGMSDPLSSINPNDIESFSVLKDASATAIYGSRASNGVIVITTKKGSKTQSLLPQFSADVTTSVSTVAKYVDVLTGDEMRALVKERYGEEHAAYQALGTANTDWQKEIYRPAYTVDANLSITGRAPMGKHNDLPYRISGGFTDQQGNLLTDHMSRGTVSLNLSPEFFDKHLIVNLNGKGVFTKNRFANSSAIGLATKMDPTKPVYSDDPASSIHGYFAAYAPNGTVNTMAIMNPVAAIYELTDIGHANRFIGNAELDYKIHGLEDLRAHVNLGLDYAKAGGWKSSPQGSEQSWHSTEQSGSGYRTEYDYTRRDMTLEAYLAYSHDFKNNHHFDIMAGYSWQNFHYTSSSNTVKLTDGSDLGHTNPAGELYLVSFFGRANYSYDNRYMITATLRNDGTSRFQNNKWGLFPSVALGWNIANEGFLKDNKTINTLKLRLSWGETGQQDVGGYYDSMPQYYTNLLGSTYYFGGVQYQPITALGYNADLKWETTETWNAGLDFGFLNDRITMGLDYYYRTTRDMINYIPVPSLGNLTNYLNTNIGNMVNQGVEFEINANIIETKDWTWQLGANFAWNRTRITKLTAAADDHTGVQTGGIDGGVGNNIQLHQVGYAPNSFYVYQQVYDKEGHPIEGEYVDRNGDGKISPDDLYLFNKPAADFTLGFNTTLTWKKLYLAVSGHGAIGNWVYNNVASNGEMFADLWTNNFTANRLSSAKSSNFNQAQYLSDYYVRDASFFKIDNITLGYTFSGGKNARFDRELGINLFFTVQNVCTFTKYDGLDPEIFSGIDNNLYPRPRNFVLGVKLNF